MTFLGDRYNFYCKIRKFLKCANIQKDLALVDIYKNDINSFYRVTISSFEIERLTVLL